ncbi:MAG: 8-oxo-dGTP diphosphatase [Turneriella sp.]|nr:8-oxo-dGTP diphosphatase [Leptospiraceae bacterium]MCX7632015.1 8-oxo-dGTP diphosphatase [Turneriella sp.]
MILATLCYVKNQGKTLMLHRNKNPDDVHYGKYNGLGGKFAAGESPEECVVREVFEESNLRIVPTLRGVMTFPQFSRGEDWYCFLFTAHEFSGELRTSCGEGDLVWIEDSALLSLPLWPGDRLFLSWLEQPRFFSAKFCYHNGELTHHEVVFY